MATLPSGDWLIQQQGREVVLFHRHTEQELVRFDPTDRAVIGPAVMEVYDSWLSDQDKLFAAFFFGYFYCANITLPEEETIPEQQAA